MKYRAYRFGEKRIIKKFLLFRRTVNGETRWLEFVRIRQEFRGSKYLGGDIWVDREWVNEKTFDSRAFEMLRELHRAGENKKEIILIRLKFNKKILDDSPWWAFGRKFIAKIRIHEVLDDLVNLTDN